MCMLHIHYVSMLHSPAGGPFCWRCLLQSHASELHECLLLEMPVVAATTQTTQKHINIITRAETFICQKRKTWIEENKAWNVSKMHKCRHAQSPTYLHLYWPMYFLLGSQRVFKGGWCPRGWNHDSFTEFRGPGTEKLIEHITQQGSTI